MQALFFGACGRSNVPGDVGQAPCVGYGMLGQHLREGDNSQAKAWAKSLSHAKCDEHGGLSICSMDLPQDLSGAHVDVVRSAFAANRSLRRLAVADVAPEVARLLAEAALQATPPMSSASTQIPSDRQETREEALGISEVKFLGPSADDNLAKLLGMLLRPVWSHGMPALRSLTIANARRNLLTDQGGISLVQALEENTRLKTLVLFGTLLGDGTAWALSSALEQNGTLESVAFYGKRLSGRGVAMIGRLVKGGQTGRAGRRLREVIVGGSEFTEEDACEFVRTFASAATKRASLSTFATSSAAGASTHVPLQSFGLVNAALGDATCRAVAAFGLLSCGLIEVSLVCGDATNEGLSALAGALGAAAKVTVPDEAGSSCSSAAGQRRQLLHLRVGSGSIAAGDAALESFVHALSKYDLPSESLQLAARGASDDACTSFRSSSSSGRRRIATNDFSTFMDEVIFKQVILRMTPEGNPHTA